MRHWATLATKADKPDRVVGHETTGQGKRIPQKIDIFKSPDGKMAYEIRSACTASTNCSVNSLDYESDLQLRARTAAGAGRAGSAVKTDKQFLLPDSVFVGSRKIAHQRPD